MHTNVLCVYVCAGPGNMELQHSHPYWATRLGSSCYFPTLSRDCNVHGHKESRFKPGYLQEQRWVKWVIC